MEGNIYSLYLARIDSKALNFISYMATGGEDGMVNIFNNVEMQLSRATFISE